MCRNTLLIVDIETQRILSEGGRFRICALTNQEDPSESKSKKTRKEWLTASRQRLRFHAFSGKSSVLKPRGLRKLSQHKKSILNFRDQMWT